MPPAATDRFDWNPAGNTRETPELNLDLHVQGAPDSGTGGGGGGGFGDGRSNAPTDAVHVLIDRDLCGPAALELADKLGGVTLAAARHVVLSLRNVEWADAAGLALLVRLRSHLCRRGATLELVHVRDSVLALLDRIGVREILAPAQPTTLGSKQMLPSMSSIPSMTSEVQS